MLTVLYFKEKQNEQKNYWIKAALILIAFLAIIPAVYAKTIIVDVNKSAKFTSIQKAIEYAKDGDKIFIKKGDYFENIKIVHKKNLTIEGEFKGKDNVWLKVADPLKTIIDIKNSSNITIKNINGIHTKKQACSGAVVQIYYSNNIKITQCVLNGSGSYGVYAYDSKNLHITNNLITQCSYRVIELEGCLNVVIEENIIADNEAENGIRITKGYNVLIKNNTIVNNSVAPIIITRSKKVKIVNNIVAFNDIPEYINAGGITVESSQHIELLANVVHKNYNNYKLVDYVGISPTTGFDADPQFVDMAKNDFRLKNSSPYIKAGINDVNIGATPSGLKSSHGSEKTITKLKRHYFGSGKDKFVVFVQYKAIKYPRYNIEIKYPRFYLNNSCYAVDIIV